MLLFFVSALCSKRESQVRLLFISEEVICWVAGAECVSPLGGVRWKHRHSRAGVERGLFPLFGQCARRHPAPHRRQRGILGVCHVSFTSLPDQTPLLGAVSTSGWLNFALSCLLSADCFCREARTSTSWTGRGTRPSPWPGLTRPSGFHYRSTGSFEEESPIDWFGRSESSAGAPRPSWFVSLGCLKLIPCCVLLSVAAMSRRATRTYRFPAWTPWTTKAVRRIINTFRKTVKRQRWT